MSKRVMPPRCCLPLLWVLLGCCFAARFMVTSWGDCDGCDCGGSVMTIWLKSVSRIALAAGLMVTPGMVSAGGDFGGVWQPYSRPAEWLGAMTVTPDRLHFAAGPVAEFEPVRAGGSVFRIIARQGDDFLNCGKEAANYVGFHILDNGQLARLDYRADTPPAEPTGNNAMEVTRNGACSVMFYTR